MQNQIYRILDANFNRLREALRVIEEYFRFVAEDESASVSLKQMRHLLTGMEAAVGPSKLLAGRDTASDCFASESRPEEMVRNGLNDILSANYKRAQEACRVIEEYSKAVAADASRGAKEIRFSLYALQKASSRNAPPPAG
jgi:thiamine-phosphate pyrophosphorylase